jgi:hypothetical protein
MMSVEVAMELSQYEREALAEIERYFRSPEEGLLGRVSRSLFKPVEVVSERLVPDKILEVAGNGVELALRGIASVTDQTLSVDGVIEQARAHAEIDDLADLRGLDLEVCDKVAEAIRGQHGLVALLEGAGCGLGGAALLAADIPLLFGVTMRVVRQLGASYGVDPHAVGEGVIAFKVFELACGGTRDRYAQLLEIEALKDELDGLEPQRRAEKAAVLASLIVSREAVKRVVSLLLSRKLLQTVPLVGAAVGAGFNYMFVGDVAETASHVYRRRFLREKQGR